MDPAIIIALVSAGVSVSGSILSFRRFRAETQQANIQLQQAESALVLEREKTQSEIQSRAVTDATELLDDLKQDRQYLRDEVRDLKKSIKTLESDFENKNNELAKRLAEVRLQLYQALERIASLEAENEMLSERNQELVQRLKDKGDCLD